MIVRTSRQADCSSIQRIYGHHVVHGTASFDDRPPTLHETVERREQSLGAGLPYLVAELDGTVAGFANSAIFRTRPAYRFTVESSVYIAPGQERQGLAKALMQQVIEQTRDAGRKQMIAAIGDSDNIASIRLHESLGFEHAGVYRSVGFKFDRWLDVVLMQLAL